MRHTVNGALLALCYHRLRYFIPHWTRNQIWIYPSRLKLNYFLSRHRYATLSPSDSRSSLASSFAAAVRNNPFPHWKTSDFFVQVRAADGDASNGAAAMQEKFGGFSIPRVPKGLGATRVNVDDARADDDVSASVAAAGPSESNSRAASSRRSGLMEEVCRLCQLPHFWKIALVSFIRTGSHCQKSSWNACNWRDKRDEGSF
jgi:hypothetical protein